MPIITLLCAAVCGGAASIMWLADGGSFLGAFLAYVLTGQAVVALMVIRAFLQFRKSQPPMMSYGETHGATGA